MLGNSPNVSPGGATQGVPNPGAPIRRFQAVETLRTLPFITGLGADRLLDKYLKIAEKLLNIGLINKTILPIWLKFDRIVNILLIKLLGSNPIREEIIGQQVRQGPPPG